MTLGFIVSATSMNPMDMDTMRALSPFDKDIKRKRVTRGEFGAFLRGNGLI